MIFILLPFFLCMACVQAENGDPSQAQASGPEPAAVPENPPAPPHKSTTFEELKKARAQGKINAGAIIDSCSTAPVRLAGVSRAPCHKASKDKSQKSPSGSPGLPCINGTCPL